MTTSIVSTEIMELDPLFSRMAGFVLPNAHFLNSNHPTPPPPAGCGEVVVHGGITGLVSLQDLTLPGGQQFLAQAGGFRTCSECDFHPLRPTSPTLRHVAGAPGGLVRGAEGAGRLTT